MPRSDKEIKQRHQACIKYKKTLEAIIKNSDFKVAQGDAIGLPILDTM